MLFCLNVPAKLDLAYNYSELSDIVQLDGAAGNSDMEEEAAVSLEDNDFLGIINAEAIKALQEGGGSSDCNSISSSSDEEAADELTNVEDEVCVCVYFNQSGIAACLDHTCFNDTLLSSGSSELG